MSLTWTDADGTDRSGDVNIQIHADAPSHASSFMQHERSCRHRGHSPALGRIATATVAALFAATATVAALFPAWRAATFERRRRAVDAL